MITHVNQVFVAKRVHQNEGGDIQVGDLLMADHNYDYMNPEWMDTKVIIFGLVTGFENVTGPNGVIVSSPVIRWTNPINKRLVTKIAYSEHAPAKEATATIDFSATTVEVGHRYVLRLMYNDLYEHPGRFTHHYEVIATSTNPEVLFTELVKKINRHKGARVSATINETAKLVTLVGKQIPRDGVNVDNYYTQVALDVTLYKTIPTGILSTVIYPVNATISLTPATPGKGNPEIIIDRENKALGYRGITHRANGIHPYIAPASMVDRTKQYAEVTVEWDTEYLSPDNAYMKKTAETVEIYIEHDDAVSTSTAEDLYHTINSNIRY